MYYGQDFYEGFDVLPPLGSVSGCFVIGLRSDLPDPHFSQARESGGPSAPQVFIARAGSICVVGRTASPQNSCLLAVSEFGLIGNRIFAKVKKKRIKMRSSWIRAGPKSSVWCP